MTYFRRCRAKRIRVEEVGPYLQNIGLVTS